MINVLCMHLNLRGALSWAEDSMSCAIFEVDAQIIVTSLVTCIFIYFLNVGMVL